MSKQHTDVTTHPVAFNLAFANSPAESAVESRPNLWPCWKDSAREFEPQSVCFCEIWDFIAIIFKNLYSFFVLRLFFLELFWHFWQIIQIQYGRLFEKWRYLGVD